MRGTKGRSRGAQGKKDGKGDLKGITEKMEKNMGLFHPLFNLSTREY